MALLPSISKFGVLLLAIWIAAAPLPLPWLHRHGMTIDSQVDPDVVVHLARFHADQAIVRPSLDRESASSVSFWHLHWIWLSRDLNQGEPLKPSSGSDNSQLPTDLSWDQILALSVDSVNACDSLKNQEVEKAFRLFDLENQRQSRIDSSRYRQRTALSHRQAHLQARRISCDELSRWLI